MYNRSKIFQEAWVMVREKSISISEALKKVWAYYKGRKVASKSACALIDIWEKFNRPANDNDIFTYSRKIDTIIKSLRTAYYQLATINTTLAVETCNKIATVINKKYQIPTYPQLFAIIVGCGEQGVNIEL